jgi:SAM-dependent methyltransferase
VRDVTEVERPSPAEGAAGLPRLLGLRCLRCLGALGEDGAVLRCELCGTAYERGPRPGTIGVGHPEGTFQQELDADVVSVLEPLLDGLAPPTCTETVIAAHAEEAGFEIGNPIWEGRFDLARALPQASGVVLDLGCGFGTSTIALARSARHVLAIDPAPARVRLTSARLRAEGLRNATVAHADGLELPVGDAVCDLVAMVGVLEWTSEGSADPLATQRAVLREVARVLRPGGVLLLGIENRFGAQYFGGMAEEHVGLRFVSLLPRRLGDAYARLAGHGRVSTYTHSRRMLLRLLHNADLQARLAVALPSYGQPQFVFDEEDFGPAWAFYLRHTYHYSSPARRLVAAAAARSPRTGLVVAPSFFALARKAVAPDPVPTVVTGTADCRGDIKTIDWGRRELRRRPRLAADEVTTEPLVAGWNARRWLGAPIRTSERRRREIHLLQRVLPLLSQRPRSVDGDARARSLRAAEDALERLGGGARCATELAALEATDADVVLEHGDFVTGNLIVADDGSVVALDAADEWAIPGRDATVFVLDLFGLRAGAKRPAVDLGVQELAAAAADGEEAARLAADLLDGELGLRRDPRRASTLVLVAVLRHYAARGELQGIRFFVERAGSGELLQLVEELAHLPGVESR